MNPKHQRKLALASLGVSFHSRISREAKKGFQGASEKMDVARSTFGPMYFLVRLLLLLVHSIAVLVLDCCLRYRIASESMARNDRRITIAVYRQSHRIPKRNDEGSGKSDCAACSHWIRFTQYE